MYLARMDGYGRSLALSLTRYLALFSPLCTVYYALYNSRYVGTHTLQNVYVQVIHPVLVYKGRHFSDFTVFVRTEESMVLHTR